MTSKQQQTAETVQAGTEVETGTGTGTQEGQLAAQLEQKLAQSEQQVPLQPLLSQPVPMIGRMVHYVAGDGSERAAIVTWVYGKGTERPGEVDLAVFTTSVEHGSQGAVYGVGNVAYDANGQQSNTWHWWMEGKPHA